MNLEHTSSTPFPSPPPDWATVLPRLCPPVRILGSPSTVRVRRLRRLGFIEVTCMPHVFLRDLHVTSAQNVVISLMSIHFVFLSNLSKPCCIRVPAPAPGPEVRKPFLANYSNPNPQNQEGAFSLYSANRVEGFWFSLLMGVFALLEDAHAFGSLGTLPGAPAADLRMSPPTSIAVAPSVPSRNNGSSSSSPFQNSVNLVHRFNLSRFCVFLKFRALSLQNPDLLNTVFRSENCF